MVEDPMEPWMPDRDPAARGSGPLHERIRELEERNNELESHILHGADTTGMASPRLASEKALAWLAAIVESSDDAIISKSLDGTVTSWNPAAERLLGYCAEEMIGQSILRIIPQDLWPEEEHILARIRGGRSVEHYETTRLGKGGVRVPVSLTVSPVRDGTGAIIGASKIARDMSAPREADRARAALAAIVESSDDAIISKDLEGRITSWNRAAERLYGYSAQEMLGQSVLRIIPPELRDEEARILQKVRGGQRLEHFETVRLTRDGRRIEVALTVSPVRSASGEIIGASKVARDLRSQREGDRAKAILAAIVMSSDDAIISKDLRGVVTSWNPAAERMYGFRAEEMIGSPIAKIIPPHLHEEEASILARIRAGLPIDHFQTTRVRKDGTTFPVSITVSPIRDPVGRVIGASKIARDITQQQEAQRKKDQFLAVLAHELRNPLAPIRNAISLFAKPLTEPQRARAQAIAERQIDHMSRLLDDLLDVSRISTGRVELQRARVDLKRLAADALDATRGLMTGKRHRVEVALDDEPLWLDADPVRITQILANLLTNAAKYTDAGGEIRFAVAREADQAVVTVSDNGIGFSPEMAERLFSLFSQDERAQSRASGGLGIGLALVREFVERHGGTVEAHSAGPDKGSRFTVRLPALTA
jgi:PAS domain S-box-containing protein